MPEWIHNRAEHLLAKNPEMSKSTAFAVATQQAHAMGKSPKGYGTKAGRSEAKQKYDTPKGDEHKANPGNLDSPKLAMFKGFVAELGCIAIEQMSKEAISPQLSRMLIGSGVGAGVGAGAGYIGGKAMEPLPVPGEEDKSYGLRGALVGAGTGALLGGGLGYMAGRAPKVLPAAPVMEAPPAVAEAPPAKSLVDMINEATDAKQWSIPNEVTPRVKVVTTPAGEVLEAAAKKTEEQRAGRIGTLRKKIEKRLKRKGKKRPDLPPTSFRMQAEERLKDSTYGKVVPKGAMKPREHSGPGYLAQLGRRRREGLARAANLEGQDVVDAGRGKYGHVKQAENVSREEAVNALERLEALEKQAPTAGKVTRYAGVGAVAAPVVGIARNLISGGRHWSGASKDAIQAMGKGRASLRALAGQSLGGAVTSGLIPLSRHQLDRHVEAGKLRDYVNSQKLKAMTVEPEGVKQSSRTDKEKDAFTTSEYSTPIEGPKRLHLASYLPHAKMAGIGPESGMSVSEYSGPLSYGRFPMVSYQPGFRAPNLRAKPFEGQDQQIYEGAMKVGSLISPTAVGSPKAQLGSSMRVGKPRSTAPSGPSIQQVSKPEGFGQPIAGAKKNII